MAQQSLEARTSRIRLQANPLWWELIYSTLHDFTGGNDGRAPYGHLIVDAKGNLYGTAGWGGSGGNGV